METVNFSGGTINNGADVTAHFVDDVTATFGSGHSFNFFVVNGGNDFVGDLGGGTIGTGGNIDATFDGDAATTPTATSGSFAAEIANDHGNIGTGGNISVTIGGNLTCGPLFVYTSNRYGGQIGTGGNITLDVAGNANSAGQAFLGLFNNGGSIGSGANFTVNVGGDLTTRDYAAFQILNNDNGNGSGPGTIGSNATLSVTAANISTGGSLFDNIFNYSGGSIGGNAAINLSVGGNLTTAQGGALDLSINNDTNGVIGSDAIIDVAANNISVGDSLNAFLTNQQGAIGGNAAINVLASAGIDAGNGAFFAIVNDDNDGTTLGGTIAGDALVHVTADHLSTEALVTSDFNLFGTIHNSGGSIVGNCNVMFDISGAITTQGRASFDILNFDDGGPNGGGIIGGHATVNINASALSIDGELLENIQNQGGSIGSNADVTADITGGLLTTASNASFFINNFDGGTIGSNATINVTANNISTGGALYATIDNTGGNIGGSAAVDFDLAGNITTQGDFAVLQIVNSGGGQIGGNASVNLNLSGDLTTQNNADFFIFNSGAIGQNASISVSAGNMSIGDSLIGAIDNTDGTIGGNAAINMNVSGTTTVTNDATFEILGSDGAASAAININGGSYDVRVSVTRSSPTSTATARSHSIMPARTQTSSKPAYSAPTARSILAVAPSRLIRY